MFNKLKSFVTICLLVCSLLLGSSTAQANWFDTFNNNTFDVATWEYLCYPDYAKTYAGTIKDGPDENDYLALIETTTTEVGGSAFGGALVSNELFTDVRVGAVINVLGDASRSNYALLGRADYIMDDGSISGHPGLLASGYGLVIYYDEGPANLVIEFQKIIFNDHSDTMKEHTDVVVPGLGHARSYYAELDIVGSDPTYITSSLYEYKGGPLVLRIPTLVDSSAEDPWEDPDHPQIPGNGNLPFTSGMSGIAGFNEDPEPAGYYTTFDDVFSVSDGPAAVNPGPVDGATEVPAYVNLSWIEAQFATGRELWIGKPGALEKVDPAPSGTTFAPANLELGQAYQWRVDQVGPSGSVTGFTWNFTTADYLVVDDFESYTDDADLRTAWVDNIEEPGIEYVFLGTGENKSMLFEVANQFDPYFTEITRTFSSPQDWTAKGVGELSLSFVGEYANVEHLMYLRLEDASGRNFTVEHPYTYACQTNSWREWSIALGLFSDGGVDLTGINKITLGLGDGTNSGQPERLPPDNLPDRDHIYVDHIILRPAASGN